MEALAEEAELFAGKLRDVAEALKRAKITNIEVQHSDGVKMAILVTLPSYLLDCRKKALESGADPV
jgi:hypothetical protein